MRLVLPILVPLALAACERKSAPPVRPSPRPASVAAPAPIPMQAAIPAAVHIDSGAAAVLRLYYRRIEAGDYRAAWRMRAASRLDEGRFAANFRPYRSYHADIGPPSRPVAAGGWIYVEVPVMITGRLRAGKSFGSAGSVTMRRREGGDGWAIYAG
jgi:hypothetical protein